MMEPIKASLDLDDFDPDDAAREINDVMAEDDLKDPYLDSYQRYGNRSAVTLSPEPRALNPEP